MKKPEHKILVAGSPKLEIFIRELFKSKDYCIIYCSKASDVTPSLEKNHIDIVLLEYSHTEETMLNICRDIKKSEAFRSIPVMFISEVSDRKAIIKAYDAGTDDYINTSDNQTEILDKIDMRLLLQQKKEGAMDRFREDKKELKLLSNKMNRLKEDFDALKKQNYQLQKFGNKLFERESIKNNFLKVLIQELRSPVSAIIGFTEILKEIDSGEEKENILETISDASRKTRELLDTALMVTEIHSEISSESMRPYKISNLIEYAVNSCSNEIKEKNIRIQQPEISEISEIIIDPGLIMEVIRIFLAKAVKQNRKNGEIRISISESPKAIELNITDTGNGYEFKEINSMASFLSSSETSGRTDWPDIKIAIAKYIMDLHHASIKIDNNPGGGSTAKLIFPVNTAKRDALHHILSQLN